MECSKCGRKVDESSLYCSNCGWPTNTCLKSSSYMTSVVYYAGFWCRFLAGFIDNFILNAVSGVILFLLYGYFNFTFVLHLGTVHSEMYLLVIFIPTAISWLYYAFMESSTIQATFGKIIMGIKVTDLEGKQISFGRATFRYFAKLLSVCVLGTGFLMVAFTSKKQGLHDIIAGCLVVKKQIY